MATPIGIATNIAKAMNLTYKTHIVINSSSFFGKEGRPVKMYVVKDAYYSDGVYSDKELFKSASGIYTCLFMRDLLYAFQGNDIPDDDFKYVEVKRKRNGAANIEWMKEVYLENGFENS